MSSCSTYRLDGKVTILTGASSGIGEIAALMFADKGAYITLCGRNEERLESIHSRCCQKTGHPERFIKALGDLTDPKIRTRTIEETIQAFGRLDILIGNAGALSPPCSFLEVTMEDFDQMVEVILKSNLFLVQECVPHLEKTQGVITLVSSISAVIGALPYYPYSLMKAALTQLTRVLAIELGPKSIRVNATSPGLAVSRIFRETCNVDTLRQNTDAVGFLHPLYHRVSTLEEQSDVLAFLVSDESSFVHGEVITIDGMSSKVRPGLNHNYYLPPSELQR